MLQEHSTMLVIKLLSFILTFTAVNAVNKDPTFVETSTGYVRGLEERSRDERRYFSWKGIPYGEPPVGNLRFQPPAPKKPWGGILDAFRYAPKCAQLDTFFDIFQGQEDCLFLNVHRPKWKDVQHQQNLPVLFVIHGGYFTTGGGSDIGPDYYMDEDVVLVTMNYRLGILGFLNTGDEAVRGNMGLKDLRLALKWVHENIENFGGDPGRITVQGQSAGGASAHLLALSPTSSALVNRATLQSGDALCAWALNRNPRKQAFEYGRRIGCNATTGEELVNCFRSMSPRQLLDKTKGTSLLYFNLDRDIDKVFVPTIETVITNDTFLSSDPEELLQSGSFKPVPLLLGSNAAEGLVYLGRLSENQEFRDLVRKDEFWSRFADQFLKLPDTVVKRSLDIRNFYFGRDAIIDPYSLETEKLLDDIYSDRFYYLGHQDTLRFYASKTIVYSYYYNKTSPFSIFELIRSINGKSFIPKTLQVGLATGQILLNRFFLGLPHVSVGVNHADDLQMTSPLEGRLRIAYRDGPLYKFSKEFVKMLADFAKEKPLIFYGIQVPKADIHDEFKSFVLNDPPFFGTTDSPFKHRYLFWKRFTQCDNKN